MFEKFIHRPVLAIVVSLIIAFLGILSAVTLPVSQFPKIAPPQVIVFLTFPGASADVLVNSALIPIERAINGVPGMRYISSSATSAGEATIQVLFDLDVDPDNAIVQVKTRVDQALNKLPPLVQLEGVIVQSVQPSMLMYVNLYGDEEGIDEKFLFNYANTNIIPEVQRIKGISQARNLGSRSYAMRIWLNPDRMRAYKIATDDVMKAISDQSIIGHPGRIGSSSGKVAQSLEYVLVYKGRYNKPEEYEDIVVRANPNGEILYLKDIAKVELDSELYDIYSTVDGHPSASIMLKQTYNSNANEVIDEVKEKLNEISKDFSAGVHYKISYDVSDFLDASIHKVIHTLIEAFILVSLVVFVFLGDWRSTLIPVLVVPVSLIGAFFSMQFFGLSINLITLFAMVLAIGIVVDDAIVVVEAVHAKMAEENISPYAAVQKVLGEISGAVIAITLLMVAVFVPIAFMTGPVGILLKQFSITMASAIVLSGVVALTLTPVLSAMILKKHSHGNDGHKKTFISSMLDKFNHKFDKVCVTYVTFLNRVIHRKKLTATVLIIFVSGILLMTKFVPSGFVPNEDQAMIYAIIQTPPGSSLEKTFAVSTKLQEVAKETLPRGYDIAWEGLSYDEASRGHEAIYIFVVVLLFVYLVLAAQYESFIIPLAVMFSLPPGIFGSFLLLKLMGLANDVYAQVGLIMLVGLLGKNAVLIVEFARQKQQSGMSVIEAAIEGAKVRFRPILMTSFAFIAGLIPMALATGAGSVANNTIGASALGGMLLGTVFGVLIVPGLYCIFASLV
ncbi:MAG: efflux RND transporter permease subunit [Rickettsiales bacterium]|nr:efflux RND transporter permease subunit [Rickettsiales bacterium]